MKKFTKKQIAIILIISFIIILVSAVALNLMTKDNIQNGIWVKGKNMNDVDLDTLSKYGIENIFLHSNAVDRFGEKNVTEWIKKANSKNIKVHIWVQCFYDNGKWINPINTKEKKINYPFFNEKISAIEKLAEIPGVSGIQLDYIRYPGNAYKYDYSNEVNSHSAISKFVSMVSDNLKNKDLTLSITVMPEKEDTKYYGQDVGTLSQYVDVVIPMAYSGNYGQDSNWIRETATYFKLTSIWANVCMGIQNYESDTNETPLSANQLKENCKAAIDGGANGVAIFPWDLMKNWFDMRDLK
ncbi:hypothetical protein MBCUT_13960 [Methanobrevibacter cuticularis]|uniref:DUF4015 domain-containing protein n=1 Tax=Methanobrevibacter cuticularis TaxID=47311 RepID=A0A166DI46_9EURY|nr:putative glycoside hydrolase [Methanobrevibacter cuticularis]KZX15623.1 hypothetical protein MBCUT_13960 [Methanobrevibacter cuticularis]